MISTDTLYQPVSYPSDHALYVNRESQRYGPYWWSLNRFMHKIESATGLHPTQTDTTTNTSHHFNFYAYMYHQVNGRGSLYLNDPRPDMNEVDQEQMYRFVEMFKGIGFYIIYTWKWITSQMTRSGPTITLWDIMDNTIVSTRFIQVFNKIWKNARIEAGLQECTRVLVRGGNKELQMLLQWFLSHDATPAFFKQKDEIFNSWPYPIDNLSKDPFLVFKQPHYGDQQYIKYQETRSAKQQRIYNQQKRIILKWILEACLLAKVYTPNYTLAWPFPPPPFAGTSDPKHKKRSAFRYTQAPIILDNPESTEDAMQYGNKRLRTDFRAMLPPDVSLSVDAPEKKEHAPEQEEEKKDTAKKEEDDEDEDEDEEEDEEDKQPKELSSSLSSMSLHDFYTIDYTSSYTWASIIRIAYDECIVELTSMTGSLFTFQDMERSLFLTQTMTTHVFFAQWVASVYNHHKAQERGSGLTKIILDELIITSQNCKRYLMKQRWIKI